MDASLKELAKLEQLAASNAGASSSKGKSVSINDSLESLLYALKEAKESVLAGNANPDLLANISKKVESTRKDIDASQKEVYNSLARFGKTLDKVRLNRTYMLYTVNIYVSDEEIHQSSPIVPSPVLLSAGSRCVEQDCSVALS